jgi:hypothetical protein
MLDIQQSPDGNKNDELKKCERIKGKDGEYVEDNVSWVERQLPSDKTGKTFIVLLGGTDPMSFRLRTAQSYARHNLTPSNWSHVLILDEFDDKINLEKASTIEVSLNPSKGFEFPPNNNAIQRGQLGVYKALKDFPNIALLQLPVDLKDIKSAVDRFKKMRNVVNGVDLVVAWLSYVWGVSRSGNPLLNECGIPSAVLVEYSVGSAGLDLTPGLASRSSCPEAIWQSAKWWQGYQTQKDNDKSPQRSGIIGWWHVGNKLIENKEED